MAEEEGRGGVLYVYGPGDHYRYAVKDSADFPDCFDLVYEDWDDVAKKWEAKAEFPSLDKGLWERLTLAIVHLQRWMETAAEKLVLEE
jgi:hypothetical protein